MSDMLPGTVIVVDDVEAMRKMLVGFLRKLDASLQLVGASNGQQALAMVESLGRAGPSRILVISDLRMPGLDGLALLTSLAESPYDVRAILMTAFPDESVHRRAARLGAVACLEKPFELDELAEVVRAAMHR